MLTLEFPDQTIQVVPLSRVELLDTEYEAEPVVRAAFTEEWNALTLPRPTGSRLQLSCRVSDPAAGITGARTAVLTLLADIADAVLLITPYGAWVPAAIESVVDTPAPLGYDVTVVVIVREPRYPTPADALRLIAGGVWQFR